MSLMKAFSIDLFLNNFFFFFFNVYMSGITVNVNVAWISLVERKYLNI